MVLSERLNPTTERTRTKMNRNQIWKVNAKSLVTFYAEVNATTREEAIEKARRLDDAEWRAESRGNFDIAEAKTFFESAK